MNHKITLDGWVSWELIEASGVISAAGEQHNLFLNQGLNLLAQYGMGGLSSSEEQTGVARFLVVGTGTAEPDPTQTLMGAEAARTNFCPVPFVFTRTGNGVYRRSVTRELTEAQGNGNLTEWGWAVTGTGTLAVRERFRDGNGTPITLTKTSAQRLRMTYHLEFRLGPVVNSPAAFTVGGVGSLTGSYSLHRESRPFSAGTSPYDFCDYHAVNALMTGLSGGVGVLKGTGPAPTYGTVGGDFGSPATHPSGATANTGTLSVGAYTAGTYGRTSSLTFGTGQGNVTHYGWTITGRTVNINSSDWQTPGYTLLLNAGQEITTKNNLKTLTISGISLSWGRA